MGLRERKKARTRRQLIDVSQYLFQTNGFEETTLEQICDEVEIRIPTLLRYFPSKVDLALAPSYDALDDFRRALSERTDNVGVIDVWRRHTRTMSALADSSALPYYRMIGSSSALVAGMALIVEQYEDVLAAALSEEAGVDPEIDLYGRLLAALVICGNRSVFRAWMQRGQPEGLLEAAVQVVDFARTRVSPRRGRDILPWTPRRRRTSSRAVGP